METSTFSKVWYRARPLRLGDVTMKAMEDHGSLTVAPGRLFVDGRLLGWSGVLGGNKRLLRAINQAASG